MILTFDWYKMYYKILISNSNRLKVGICDIHFVWISVHLSNEININVC